MKFLYIFTIASIIPITLNGMFSLNYLEKALVLREIELRGLTAIEQSLNNSSEPNIIRSSSEPILQIKQQNSEPTLQRASSAPRARITSFLTINTIFFRQDKTETQCNPVIEALFKKIDQIELQHGYIPTTIETIDGHYYYNQEPTNTLGHHTRYYWEDESSKDTVRIICRITNKKGLEEIVKQERIRLKQAINRQ